MNISMMVACDENNVIGVDNYIPWKIPSDLKNFKKYTSGKTVVMGRKTFESIPKKFRPLPKRRNIVLTTNKKWSEEGVEVAHNMQEAFKMFKPEEEVFIIGGEEIYSMFFPSAKTIYVSRVQTGGRFVGDAYFPRIDEDEFEVESSEFIELEDDEFPYTLVKYVKKPPTKNV